MKCVSTKSSITCILFCMIFIQGYCVAEPQTDNTVFRFVGSCGEPNWVIWQYELTIVGELQSDIYGLQFYTIRNVDFRIGGYYVVPQMECWGPPPQPTYGPFTENVSLRFTSEDFDLSPPTFLHFSAAGSPVNPNSFDFYDGRLVFAHPMTIGLPSGGRVEVSGDIDFGSSGLEDCPICMIFYGYICPAGWEACFGTQTSYWWVYTECASASGAGVLFRDADSPTRQVVGAVADGESEVIVEVRSSPNAPTGTIPENCGTWVDEDWVEVDHEVWQRTWKAPADFAVPGQADSGRDRRQIDFDFQVDGDPVAEPPFSLYKPPVVLLHGIFANRKSWDVMLRQLISRRFSGNSFFVSVPEYDNDEHFHINVDSVYNDIKRAIESASNGIPEYPDDVVVKKADIVAHSMGGILATLCAGLEESSDHERIINRIITIDTPHNGSEFANFTLHFVFEEMGHQRREHFLSGKSLPYLFFARTRGSIDGGAVEDLQVGSQAMLYYRQIAWSTPVPAFAIVSEHTEDRPSLALDLVYGGRYTGFGFWYWDNDICTDHSHFSCPGDQYHPLCIEDTLFPSGRNSSDFVVSTLSQSGGLYPNHVLVRPSRDHTTVTNDPSIIDAVVEMLAATEDYYGHRFEPVYGYPQPRVGPVTIDYDRPSECGAQMVSLAYAQENMIQIVEPVDGDVFQPGDSVHVIVGCDIPELYGITVCSSSLVFQTDNDPPWEIVLCVDSSYAGLLTIGAIAELSDQNQDAPPFDTVLVNIVPNGSPVKLEVLNGGSFVGFPGDECNLTVMGLYSDNIWRDVSSHHLNSNYGSSDVGIADIDADGRVTLNSPGHTQITVENGVSIEFLVLVKGAPGEIDHPTPYDGQANVPTTVTLAWWGSEFASWYDLFLWKAGSDRPLIPMAAQLAESFYDNPDTLIPATTYRWQVVAKNSAGETQGPIWTFTTTGATEGESKIAVSPNPFVPSRGHAVLSFFGEGLPYTSIRVFNKAGELVRSLEETQGQTVLNWDATSNSGDKLASGVYIWISTSRDSKHTKGKFAIIR